tara:strand:+ start:40 stop:1122 length:1083 start_codon:yes stop_codon:yes gene_type:complete
MIIPNNFSRRWADTQVDLMLGLQQIHEKEKVVNGFFTNIVEERLKEVSNRKYALLCRSGSHAIGIALITYGLGYGDKVIVPSYSCPATLSSITIIGCEPVFCEINKYGMLDTEYLDSLSTSGAKAVLATGLYGDVHDHDGVKKFCDQYDMVYINDAAQSQFALYKGVDSLKLGDIVCMSFADNKPIPVLGTFGAVLTDNEDHYHRIKQLRKNGKISRLTPYVSTGFSSHPDEDKAVQILASWKHFDTWQDKKKEISSIYDAEFKGKIETRPIPKYSTWNAHKYVIMVTNKFISYKNLLKAGLETEQHYVDNFATLPWTPDTLKTYPMTDKFVQQSLTISNDPYMTDYEIDTVISTVIKYS